MNKVQKQTKVSNEGDGYAVTAWGVVENGKVVPWKWGVVENGKGIPWNIYPTRELARQEQKELTGWDDDNRYSVRKLEIRVVEGR